MRRISNSTPAAPNGTNICLLALKIFTDRAGAAKDIRKMFLTKRSRSLGNQRRQTQPVPGERPVLGEKQLREGVMTASRGPNTRGWGCAAPGTGTATESASPRGMETRFNEDARFFKRHEQRYPTNYFFFFLSLLNTLTAHPPPPPSPRAGVTHSTSSRRRSGPRSGPAGGRRAGAPPTWLRAAAPHMQIACKSRRR